MRDKRMRDKNLKSIKLDISVGIVGCLIVGAVVTAIPVIVLFLPYEVLDRISSRPDLLEPAYRDVWGLLKTFLFLFLPAFGAGLMVISSILWFSWRRMQDFLSAPQSV